MKKVLLTLTIFTFVISCNKENTGDDSPCQKPNISLSENSGTVSVSLGGNGDFYEIEYGDNGFSKGTGTTVTGNYQIQVQGLTNGAHDFYARANCGGNLWSSWAGPKSILVQNGVAPTTCAKPTDLSLAYIDGAFRWEHPGANLYQVEYGVNGFALGTGKRALANNKSYGDYSFAANTTYDFYVRAICTVGDTSQWAGPFMYYSSDNYQMCLPPTNLSAYRNGGSIQYSFDDNGEDKFETSLSTSTLPNSNSPHSTTSTSGAYTGIYSNVTYYFFVRSVCKDGSKTAWSGPVTIY